MLIEPQFATPEIEALWTADARIARWLAFEGALAEAQGELGVIPKDSGAAIAAACKTLRLDAAKILDGAKAAGTPIIPFTKALNAAIAQDNPEAAKFVHYGATTQDVVDTAMMLALKNTIALVIAELEPAIAHLKTLAQSHAATPMAARTVLQQATPITFGLKAALWAAGLSRGRAHLTALREADLALQLGGAVGTLSVMGAKGAEVRSILAEKLGLADPGLVWHSLRDPILRCATALTEICGASAKIARDVQLLMQTEVAEVAEESGDERGGSSAMPHKHNPVDSMVCVACAQVASGLLGSIAQAMVGILERSPGEWHGEWIALPMLTQLAHAASRSIKLTVTGLTVDAHAMADNLERLHGLMAAEALSTALFAKLGKTEAQKLVRDLSARVVKEKTHLKTLAMNEPGIKAALSDQQLDDIFAHKDALLAAEAETHRVLAMLD